MDDIIPTISVDFDTLCSQNSPKRNEMLKGHNNESIASNEQLLSSELSLTIKPNNEIFPIHSTSDNVNSRKKPLPLDLQSVDFLGPADVVKKLFAIPYTDNSPLFALHKMGNTLLISDVPTIESNIFTSNSDNKKNNNNKNNNNYNKNNNENYARNNNNDINNNDFIEQIMEQENMSNIFSSLPPYPEKSLSPQRLSNNQANLDSISINLNNKNIDINDDNNITELSSLMISASLFSDQIDDQQLTSDLNRILIPIDTTYSGLGLGIDSTFEKGDFIPNTTSSSFSLRNRLGLGEPLKDGSPFLPPPEYFMPVATVPNSSRQVLTWNLHEMKLAMSSDINIYKTDHHSAFTLKAVDTTVELNLSTCLDMYLDNVMTNVPELAVALHSKGFIRGLKMTNTQDIPYLNPSNNPNIQSDPLFDPEVIDIDASTIMRFLKENCRREDGTYILCTSPNGDSLHLYDLGLASMSRQKKFKWMLAMLSYRFAVRLGHHSKISTISGRILIRQRQLHLFRSCYDLLQEIKEMGGEDHCTIKAAVLEQMSDIHLSKVDDNNKIVKQNQDSSNTCDMNDNNDDISSLYDEDFCKSTELSEAIELLSGAVDCLSNKIKDEFENINNNVNNEDMNDEINEHFNFNKHNDNNKDEGNKVSSEDIDSDDDDTVVIETLNLQLTGILHKMIQATVVMVIESIKNAKISNCLEYLFKLVPSCSLWTNLKTSLLQHWNHKSIKNKESLWGADMTIIQSLPIIWDLLGETCREISKQTAGISLEDSKTREHLRDLVNTWNSLSEAVLEGDMINIMKKTSFIVSNNNNSINIINKVKTKSKTKSKNKKKTEINSQAKNNWVMWSSSIFPASTSKFPSDITDENDVLSALAVIHNIIAPILLEDSGLNIHLYDQNQQVIILSMSISEDLHVILVMAYCFLCASISYHHKATGGQAILNKNKPSNKQKMQRAGGTNLKNNDKNNDKNNLLMSDVSVCECLRRLADTCNVIGQRLVRISISTHNIYMNKTLEDNNNSGWETLSIAEKIFNSALILFISVNDSPNTATVRCNISSLLRLKSNWISMNEININSSIIEINKDLCKLPNPIECLDQAIENCRRAQICIKTSLFTPIKDAVSQEAALAYLSIGILKRKEYFPNNKNELDDGIVSNHPTKPFLPNPGGTTTNNINNNDKQHTEEQETSVITSLTTALNLFQELRNERQIAAAYFQLGSFFSSIWSYNPSKASHRLEQALLHYREAHRYDVGPTLVLILVDMCDLYLASYSASEIHLSNINNKLVSPWSPSPETELVISLLGGAYQSLLETRFAFTIAVAERYGEKITKLAYQVSQRTCKVLLKLLKAQSKEIILPASSNIYEESIISIRKICSELLRDNEITNSNNISEELSMLISPSCSTSIVQNAIQSSKKIYNIMEILNQNIWLEAALIATSFILSSKNDSSLSNQTNIEKI